MNASRLIVGRPKRAMGIAARMGFCACGPAMLCGCFTLLATMAPYNRDLSSLQRGSDHADVIAAYGEPDSTAYRDGREVDSYLTNPHGPKGAGEKAVLVAASMLLDAACLNIPALFIYEATPLEAMAHRLKKRRNDGESSPRSSCDVCFFYDVHYSTAGKVESVETSYP